MVGTRNMWINAGRQQFNMPRGEAIPFPGEVGVSVKDIKRVHRNMKRIARELKGTEFSIKEVGKTLTCTSPWGHVLRVHQAGQLTRLMDAQHMSPRGCAGQRFADLLYREFGAL